MSIPARQSERRCAIRIVVLVAAAAMVFGCGSPPTATVEEGPAARETPAAAEGTTTAKGEAAVAGEKPAAAPAQEAEPTASQPSDVSTLPVEPSEEPQTPAEAAVPDEAPAPEDVDWEGSAQKWVPIFSLESEGVYLGAAQVAGPPVQVEKVKGVAELRLRFKDLGRIYAYIPVATISLTKLDRVQGVSVWATGDLELAGF